MTKAPLNKRGFALQTQVLSADSRNLLLRNHCLALHWLFAGGRSAKCAHASYRLTIFCDLKVVAGVRGQTIQLSVMIFAVGAIGPLSCLRQIRTVGAVLNTRVARCIAG